MSKPVEDSVRRIINSRHIFDVSISASVIADELVKYIAQCYSPESLDLFHEHQQRLLAYTDSMPP